MKFSVLKPLSETQEKAKVAGSTFSEDGKEASLCTLAQRKAASPWARWFLGPVISMPRGGNSSGDEAGRGQ